MFVVVFEKEDIAKISASNFNYSSIEAAHLAKQTYATQRKTDFTVREAAKRNVLASQGDGVFGISKMNRDRKREKLSNWLNLRDRKKSNAPTHQMMKAPESTVNNDERPRFRPVDMIKVLDVHQEKQLIERSPSGRIHRQDIKIEKRLSPVKNIPKKELLQPNSDMIETQEASDIAGRLLQVNINRGSASHLSGVNSEEEN